MFDVLAVHTFQKLRQSTFGERRAINRKKMKLLEEMVWLATSNNSNNDNVTVALEEEKEKEKKTTVDISASYYAIFNQCKSSKVNKQYKTCWKVLFCAYVRRHG